MTERYLLPIPGLLAESFRVMRTRATACVYTRTMQLLIDGFVVGLTLYLAYLIRFDGSIPPAYQSQLVIATPYVVLIYLITNHVWGVYRLVWHFVGPHSTSIIATSVASAAIVAAVASNLSAASTNVARLPLGVSAIHPLLVLVGWIAARALRRLTYGRAPARGDVVPPPGGTGNIRRLLLIGAGQNGVALLRELGQRHAAAVGFLDDNPDLKSRTIEGCPVLGTRADLEGCVEQQAVNEVVLCDPETPHNETVELANRCQRLGVHLSTVPTLAEIALGTVNVNRLRPVRMEELLGRASTPLEPGEEVMGSYRHRRILVTGAAGSIGSELARQLIRYEPSELVLLDKDENSLYEVSLELGEAVVPVVASIREPERLRQVFEEWRPEIVFHAAAYKHVPLMEAHPREAILNNVIGTKNLAGLARQHDVDRFVLISTDKAVTPKSIMGASKRAAELIVQREAASASSTRYCCVRFGNVLGSRASVVPLFQRQIEQGKPITVTHPDVRRYFMTIPEAVRLVIQAGSMARHGEIFFLDMGDPVNIADLARRLVELSGLAPDRDIPIEFTSLRPGEKLEETLVGEKEGSVSPTAFPGISTLVAHERSRITDRMLGELESAALCDDKPEMARVLRQIGIAYHGSCLVDGPRQGVEPSRGIAPVSSVMAASPRPA